MLIFMTIFTLLGAGTPGTQTTSRPPLKRGALVHWWENPEYLVLFSQDPLKQNLMIDTMKRYELKLWDAQTKYKTSLFTIRKAFIDLSQSSEDLNSLFHEQVAPQILAKEKLKLEARLFIRNYLNQDMLADLMQKFPRFFERAWFRKSKMAVFFKGKQP